MDIEEKTGETSQEQPDSVNNIFDSVFRTMVEYLSQLIIPVINEVFQTVYPLDEPLKVLKNEHAARSGKIITDLFFELGQKYYHAECQSVTDGRMVIRMMEYASAIAIEHAVENEDGSWDMDFPNSCVIYLRSTRSTPDKLTMHMKFPGGERAAFNVPLLKVQEYTKDELFQKNLLMLLPYYLMRYEKECKKIGKLDAAHQKEADRKMDTFLKEYQDICDRLYTVCEKGEQYYLYQTLVEQIASIAEYLAPHNEKERVKVMGGTVIKPQAQVILEQGQFMSLVELVQKGIITLKQAAEQRSLSEEAFVEQCRKYNLNL